MKNRQFRASPMSAAGASVPRRHTGILAGVLVLAVGNAPALAFASYNCTGTVSFLGIDGGGDLAIQLANSTPIHKICNVNASGSYPNFNVASCKIAYATALAARVTGKTVTLYYNDQLTCATLPSWAGVPSMYFMQGPD